MSNGIVLIQSYCDSTQKLQVLKKTVKEFKSLGLDVLLTSPLNIDNFWYEDVDWYIHDHENPIMWDEKRFIHWKESGNLRFETVLPDYGWTVYHQIKAGFNVIRNQEYDHVFIANYDLKIDETVRDIALNKKEGWLTHKKSEWVFNPGMIFLSLSRKNAEDLIQSFDRSEYSFDTNNIAEFYLGKKLGNIPSLKNIGTVYDHINYDQDIWNQSSSDDFKVFVDSETTVRIYYTILNRNKSHVGVVNENLLQINNSEEFIDFPIKREEIKRCGVFVDGEFYDFFHLFSNDKKINRIKKWLTGDLK